MIYTIIIVYYYSFIISSYMYSWLYVFFNQAIYNHKNKDI